MFNFFKKNTEQSSFMGPGFTGTNTSKPQETGGKLSSEGAGFIHLDDSRKLFADKTTFFGRNWGRITMFALVAPVAGFFASKLVNNEKAETVPVNLPTIKQLPNEFDIDAPKLEPISPALDIINIEAPANIEAPKMREPEDEAPSIKHQERVKKKTTNLNDTPDKENDIAKIKHKRTVVKSIER